MAPEPMVVHVVFVHECAWHLNPLILMAPARIDETHPHWRVMHSCGMFAALSVGAPVGWRGGGAHGAVAPVFGAGHVLPGVGHQATLQ